MLKLNRKRVLKILGVAVAIALAFNITGVGLHVERYDEGGILDIGQGGYRVSFVIGTETLAAGTADYVCDGVDDDVQFQAALDALPAGGGQLVVLAGTYVFSAAISRAIDNVTFVGTGLASNITWNGVNPVIDIGVQSNWSFINLRTDAGGIDDTGPAVEVTYVNVDIGGTHWAYDTSHDIGPASWDIPVGRSATTIVAASDSSVQGIAQADYWCDGTADDVEIQAALNALPAAGGRVLLLEGTYVLVANITIPANTTLEGQGWATILNFDDSGAGTVTNAGAITINGDRVRIANLKAQLAAGCGAAGTRPNIVGNSGFDYAQIDRLWLYGDETVNDASEDRQNGIYFSNVSDYSSITNNWIENNRYNGMFIRDSKRNIFIGNTLFSNSTRGMYIRANTFGVFSGNFFESNAYNGLELYLGSSGNEVTGNTFDQNGHSGIYLYNGAHYNTITGNALYRNARSGILSDSSDYNTITGNLLRDNEFNGATYSGIELNDSDFNTISGNTVYHSGLHGIELFRSDNNSVTGNGCYNMHTGDGINITGDGTANSDYNTVTGNNLTDNADDGVEVAGGGNANNNTVMDNQVTGNIGTAVVDAGTNTMVRNNEGWVTENFGTATLLNGQVTVVVAHGLSATPTVVLITFTENPTNLMADWWVDNVGAVNFTFNGVDPGASNLDFYWEAKVR